MRKIFVSMSAIALTALSLLPKPALSQQPNLQAVTNSESGDVYLLDYNSLRRNGTMIQYTFLVRYNSTHYDDQNRPSVGAYTKIIANCATGRFQVTESAIYGPGWVVTQSNNSLSPVAPFHINSVGATVFATACQATN
jgi:hypothetical protein